VVSGFELAMRTPGTRLRAGGPGTDAVVVCGAFLVGEADHPAWRGLPRLIHLPGTDGRPPDWLAALLDALAAEAFDGGPGRPWTVATLPSTAGLSRKRETGRSPGAFRRAS
jgi:hypothetical protein